MSRGTADDDAPIEITPEIIEGSLETDVPSGPVRSSFAAAAVTDPRADLAFYLEEAAAIAEADAASAAGGAHAPALLYEIGRIRERALADGEAALASFRQALAGAPGFLATWGALRRIFSARGLWTDLIALLDHGIQAAPLSARDRADLWIERGRTLEDRLARRPDAASSYGAALDASPDHPPALLALLMLASRAGDRDGIDRALAGLARRADDDSRRAALSVERARVLRRAEGAAGGEPGGGDATAGDAGAAAALQTVREALPPAPAPAPAGGPDARASGAPGPTPPALLSELEQLARLREAPPVQIGALELLARHAPPGEAALQAALHRARAGLLRDAARQPEAAFVALADARRLWPDHPLITGEMADIADQTGRADLLAQLLDQLGDGAGVAAAALRAEAAMVAARLVEALARSGKAAEALDLLRKQGDAWGDDPAARAVHVALLAETGDIDGLADAFERHAERSDPDAAAHALVRAATLRDRVLNDAQDPDPQRRQRAESLYRRALELRPGYAPAVDGLEAMLRADARWGDLARLFEDDLARMPAQKGDGDGDGDAAAPARARRRYLLEQLVALHRDWLGDAPRALEHQRRLVALDPGDLPAWVARRDLELALSLAPGGAAAGDQVATLVALAERAGDATVAAALRAEAARLAAGAGAASDLAEGLYRQARGDAGGGGLAAGGLEALLVDPADRLDAIAAELDATPAGTPSARALRYRLALAHASAQRWASAIEILRPLRQKSEGAGDGDPLARALSGHLARQSGDAALALALAREKDGATAGLATAADLGEALERLGDRAGAAAAFRAVSRRERTGGNATEAGGNTAEAVDAALGSLRLAATADPPSPAAVVDALRALADAATDNAAVADAARREADLCDAARGQSPPSGPGASADDALLGWMIGVRGGDHRRVAESMVDLAVALAPPPDRSVVPEAEPLLVRAAARSRLAGGDAADAIHRRAWGAARGSGALAHSASDLAGASPATWAEARAARSGGALATAIDLERALDDENGGRLGDAIAAYSRILARDADHLEAMEGVRRVARAARDGRGEARAAARLAALIRTPARAGRLFAEAGELFETNGRPGDAIAAYTKALERLPDDDTAFSRLADLLRTRAAADAKGDTKSAEKATQDAAAAQSLDRLLGHRLQRRAVAADPVVTVALLSERAHNRLRRLDDRENAVEDFKRILKIDPHHQDSLRQLATLAIEMRYPADAAKLLERYLAVAQDHDAAAAALARLELAQALENAHDRPRAIETLKRAVAARPGDTVPLERLANLFVRSRDWAGAIDALHAWEQAVSDPRLRSDLHLRIGALLRDQAYDLPAAALSFRRAAELDPLGDGTAALARLHEAAGDTTGRHGVLEDAVAEMRRGLAQDPLDLPRLRRLRDLLESTAGSRGDAEPGRAVTQVLALLGAAPADATGAAPPPRAPAREGAGALWGTMTHPEALGFLTELWPTLADAAIELHPANAAEAGAVRQNRLAAGAEPRLAWLEETAAVLGIAGLSLHLALHPTARDDGAVTAIELPAPALVFGATAVAGGAAPSFWFGRALGLLRQRATVIARLSPDELRALFAAAAAVAGAAPGGAGDARPADAAAEAGVKALSRALARRERKALALQASRFGFEKIDAEAWQRAVLRTADRLGLVLSGDITAAARALGRFGETVTPAEIWRDPAVVDLLRFGLSGAYLESRRLAGLARS